jgi:hypothetical protein
MWKSPDADTANPFKLTVHGQEVTPSEKNGRNSLGYDSFVATCTGTYNETSAVVGRVQIDGLEHMARFRFLKLPSVPSMLSISTPIHWGIKLDWVGDDSEQISYYELQVSWNADMSSPLPTIVYPCCAGGKSCCKLSTLTYVPPYQKSGLRVYARLRRTNPYRFPENEAIEGMWSTTFDALAIGQPSAPNVVSRAHVLPNNNASGVLLSWHRPTDIGLGEGIPEQGLATSQTFDLQMKKDDAWLLYASFPPTITQSFVPLVKSGLYMFRVRGSNELGAGEWSSDISFTAFSFPAPAPAPVLKFSRDFNSVTFDGTGLSSLTAPITSVLVEFYRDFSFRPCCNDDTFVSGGDCGSLAGALSAPSVDLELSSSSRLTSIDSRATVSCSGCNCIPSSGLRQGTLLGIPSGAKNCTWLISADSDISLQFISLNLLAASRQEVWVYRCSHQECASSLNTSRTLVARLNSSDTVNGTSASYIHSSNTNYLQIIFTSDATDVSNRVFMRANWTLQAPTLIREQKQNNSNITYSFKVDMSLFGLERGLGYRVRILIANELGYSTRWSPLSHATQAQMLPVPAVEFLRQDAELPVKGVKLGNLTYTLNWNSANMPGREDFIYRIRKNSDPEYPIVGSMNSKPNKAVYVPEGQNPFSFDKITADRFESFQHMRTWGAVDLDLFAAGGRNFLALLNSKPLGIASNDGVKSGYVDDKSSTEDKFLSEALENWGYVGKDVEALMIYVHNVSTGAFRGDCQYVPNAIITKSTCPNADQITQLGFGFCEKYQGMFPTAIQPHCSAFMDPPNRMYQYDGTKFARAECVGGTECASRAALKGLNAHQMISSYGAKALRTFQANNETYLLVANTRRPKNFMCVLAGSEYPTSATTVTTYAPTFFTDGRLKTPVEWKFVKQCLGWNDTVSCNTGNPAYPTRCVAHPAGSCPARLPGAAAPQSCGSGSEYLNRSDTDRSHSVLYRFDTEKSEFFMHQVLLADQPTAIATVVSNSSNVPPIVAIAQDLGDVQVFSLVDRNTFNCSGYSITAAPVSKSKCLQRLQTLNSSGATAVTMFLVRSEPVLIIAHKADTNRTRQPRMDQASLYFWRDGRFFPHATLFRALPTDGAACLENVNFNGRFFIVICQSSACDGTRTDVEVQDEYKEYVGANGRCSVLYEWTNSSMVFLQVLPVAEAQAMTSFTRPSTRKGASMDYYLLVAGNGTVNGQPSSESVLLRWESTTSAASILLFQGYARVRNIYTRQPRRWAVLTTESHQWAAVATAGHFEVHILHNFESRHHEAQLTRISSYSSCCQEL